LRLLRYGSFFLEERRSVCKQLFQKLLSMIEEAMCDLKRSCLLVVELVDSSFIERENLGFGKGEQDCQTLENLPPSGGHRRNRVPRRFAPRNDNMVLGGEASFVPVNCTHGERWQADRDIFGAAFLWSGVAHPFAGMSNDGLSGRNVEGAGLVFDSQHSF
jgi:hypothetical protein